MSLVIVPIVVSSAGLLAAERGLLPQDRQGRAANTLLLCALWLVLIASTAAALARGYTQPLGRAADALLPALMVSTRLAWERSVPSWAASASVALGLACMVAVAAWLIRRPQRPRRITSLAARMPKIVLRLTATTGLRPASVIATSDPAPLLAAPAPRQHPAGRRRTTSSRAQQQAASLSRRRTRQHRKAA